jgi:hypothetical protein
MQGISMGSITKDGNYLILPLNCSVLVVIIVLSADIIVSTAILCRPLARDEYF